VATVSPDQNGFGVDWETITILSFAALCFAALAFAVYLIWAKAQGTPLF